MKEKMKGVFAILVLFVVTVSAEEACTSNSLCTCELKDGNIIDLTPLGDEEFTVNDPNGAWTYEYRPCAPFKEGDNCTDVIMCQLEQLVGANHNALGKPDTVKYLKVEDSYMIRYEGDAERVSLVKLICSSSENSTFSYEMEAPSGTYNFELSSPFACEIAENKTTSTSTPSTTTPTTTKSSSTTKSSTTKSSSTTKKSSTTSKTTKTTKKSSTTQKSTKTTTIKPVSTTQGASAVSSSIMGVLCLALLTMVRHI